MIKVKYDVKKLVISILCSLLMTTIVYVYAFKNMHSETAYIDIGKINNLPTLLYNIEIINIEKNLEKKFNGNIKVRYLRDLNIIEITAIGRDKIEVNKTIEYISNDIITRAKIEYENKAIKQKEVIENYRKLINKSSAFLLSDTNKIFIEELQNIEPLIRIIISEDYTNFGLLIGIFIILLIITYIAQLKINEAKITK